MRYGMKTVEPLVIRASRGKTLALLFGSLVFVLGSVFLIYVNEDGDTSRLWWCLAFFGPCALIFAWLLVRPQMLVLNGEGFILGGGLVRSPKLVRWKDIEGFHVYRLPKAGEMIGYNFAAGVKKSSVARNVIRGLAAEAALPRGWPLSPGEMAKLLNDYRNRALVR